MIKSLPGALCLKVDAISREVGCVRGQGVEIPVLLMLTVKKKKKKKNHT